MVMGGIRGRRRLRPCGMEDKKHKCKMKEEAVSNAADAGQRGF